jgi:hypothetical protein
LKLVCPSFTTLQTMSFSDSDIEPIEITLPQQFELDKMNRTIDACQSVEDLRKLARLFAQAWMNQKAATAWALKQSLPPPWGKEVREPALDGEGPEGL